LTDIDPVVAAVLDEVVLDVAVGAVLANPDRRLRDGVVEDLRRQEGSEKDPKHVDPDLGWPLDVIPDDERSFSKPVLRPPRIVFER
jgi:hypothetical protein